MAQRRVHAARARRRDRAPARRSPCRARATPRRMRRVQPEVPTTCAVVVLEHPARLARLDRRRTRAVRSSTSKPGSVPIQRPPRRPSRGRRRTPRRRRRWRGGRASATTPASHARGHACGPHAPPRYSTRTSLLRHARRSHRPPGRSRSSVTRSKPGPHVTSSARAVDRVDLVVAGAAEQLVGVEAAVQRVVAVVAAQDVLAAAALELVVARAALDRVVAATRRTARRCRRRRTARRRRRRRGCRRCRRRRAASSLPSWPLIESASTPPLSRSSACGAVDGLVLGLHGDRLEDRRARRAAGQLAEVRRAAQAVEARVVERRVAR